MKFKSSLNSLQVLECDRFSLLDCLFVSELPLLDGKNLEISSYVKSWLNQRWKLWQVPFLTQPQFQTD